MKKLFVGTSGYVYSHWENGVFYPLDLPKSKKLEYYCQHFKTVELNNTFYRLPNEKVFESWYQKTPKNFIFAVKLSRFITHIKKLVNCKKPLEIFLKRALKLKEKLGPILIQLPPNFKLNFSKLENFVEVLLKNSPPNLKFAFEFRNETWFKKEVWQFLKEKNIAWVIQDSPHWPKKEIISANFIYIRMHGSKILFSSKYTREEILNLAQKIKKWLKEFNVYCYFNNDAHGFAVQNAKELLSILKS